MTRPSKQPVVKETQGAGRSEAVASSSGEQSADAVAYKVCADCGSKDVVVTTSDPAAPPTPYCALHRPANVLIPPPSDNPGDPVE